MYRPDIDGLRAIAVLAVVFFHLDMPLFAGGFVGVDVFFVISGFLITRLILEEGERGRFSFANFYLRRARRLLPALGATLALTLLAGAVLLTPSQLETLGRTALFAMASVSNFQFWMETGYFNPDAHLNPLLHTWSLSVEEQFYLVWPATMVLFLAFARRWLLPFVVAGIVVGLAASEWAVGRHETAAFFLLPFRMFELLLGAVMVWVLRWHHSGRLASEIMALAGLAMILYPVLGYTPDTPFPGLAALPPCLGTALLIQAREARVVAWPLRTGLAVGVGKISYSLYLVHWPIIVIYQQWRFDPISDLERAWLLVGAFVLAALMYRFVETPFRRPSGERGDARPVAAARGRGLLRVGGALAVLAALAIPAAHMWSSGGWTWRFERSEQIEQLLSGRTLEPSPTGDVQSPVLRIAVAGDSHSTRVFLGLMEWGLDHGVEVVHEYMAPGCPPLIGIEVLGSAEQTRQCNERRARTFASLESGGYDIILLSARWGFYSGHMVGDGPSSGRSLALDAAEGNHRDDARSREVLAIGLERTVRALQQTGARVVFIGQVPPLGADPYPCIERQSTWREVEEQCIAVEYAERRGEAVWTLDMARSLSGLASFDPFDVFCAGQQCRITRDGRMLYNDADHLNNHGSRILAAQLGPWLLDLPPEALEATVFAR